MTCQEFLNGYSDYLDGELDQARAAEWRQHVSECESCRRYDEVLRQGLSLVRDLPAIEPSPDFESKLHRRIWGMEMDDGVGGSSTSIGAVASLAIAATLALIAWSPLMWRYVSPVPPAAVDASSMEGAATVTGGAGAPAARSGTSSFTAIADAVTVPTIDAEPTTPWQLYSAGDSGAAEGTSTLDDLAAADTDTGVSATAVAVDSAGISEPGPYSPLIVGPPVFQSGRRPAGDVRAVSTSPFD